MKSITFQLVGVVLLGTSLLCGDVAAQVIWQCAGVEGQEIFTDRPKIHTDCRMYQLQPKSTVMVPQSTVVPQRRDAEVNLSVRPTRQEAAATERPAEDTRPQGLISFGTLNRLAVGMSEAEVLNLAGSPRTKNLGAWVYLVSDDSMLELRFGSGRIVEIRQYQPAP